MKRTYVPMLWISVSKHERESQSKVTENVLRSERSQGK